MRLKHMVKDKINYRATGKRSSLTRQTNQGRANDGGLKIGEMERDGIMAHGLSYFLNESYMVRGDQYYMAVCNKTGTIAIYNPDKNLFMSPFSDGPLVFNKSVDGEPVLDVFSKFGRSFSVLRIPYALKLLIQELQVLNVQMRIITEENVDQLLNLSYQSRNIEKLLHTENTEKSIKDIIDNYKKQVETTISETTNLMYRNIARNNNLAAELANNIPQELDGKNVENVAQRISSQPEFLENEQMGNMNDDSDDSLGWSWGANVNKMSPQQMMIQQQPKSPEQMESIDYENLDSPGYAPPTNINPELRGEWTKLSKQQQNDVLMLPDEQQDSAIVAMLSSPQQQQPQIAGFRGFYAPNFQDETLQRLFSNLSKEEQIELLKLSNERQLEKLKLMAKEREEELNTKIVIPKTAAQEMYDGKLSLLAPVSNTLVNTSLASTTPDTNTNTNTNTNTVAPDNTASNDGIKKIITFN